MSPPSLAVLFALTAVAFAQAPLPSGDAVLRAPLGDSELVITTTARLAGAIHSLTWKGQEYIDSHDHGRQLQAAWNMDAGTPILNETFNPTEAGSMADGPGATSSSRLLFLHTAGAALQTVTQPAFWLRAGEKSGGQPAKNTTVLSNHLLTKRVQIGYRDLPNVVRFDVTITLPIGERHSVGVFEAVTGYMPPEFSEFRQFNSATGELEALSDGPGEIDRPVVLMKSDGSHAMGIFAPPQRIAQAGLEMTGPTYGRFRFAAEKVVKWNCVFRLRAAESLKPGEYPFRTFVVVGDVGMVVGTIRALHREFRH